MIKYYDIYLNSYTDKFTLQDYINKYKRTVKNSNLLKILHIMTILQLPIHKIIKLYKSKKLSPVEVTKECIKQVEKYLHLKH